MKYRTNIILVETNEDLTDDTRYRVEHTITTLLNYVPIEKRDLVYGILAHDMRIILGRLGDERFNK